MKLQHTLGGLEGLDPVAPELRVFVEPWEERIFGIHTAMMALSPQLTLPQTSSTFHTIWTWADLRKGAEAMNPFDYFKYRYYEKWLGGISGYFVANGYFTQNELDARTQAYLDFTEQFVTAVASVVTAVCLFPLVPRIFQMVEAVKISEDRRVKLAASPASPTQRPPGFGSRHSALGGSGMSGS